MFMKRQLVLATRNLDKAREIQALLGDLGIAIRTLADFPDVPDVVEDGETCRANAIKKAVAVARHTGLVTLADDTGLEVEALGGRPGAFAARYAGEHASYEDNCRKLLKELAGVPRGKRRARFITVAAVALPAGEAQTAEGILEGEITEASVGTGGFGYDPVFRVPEIGKTLAEIPPEEKNRISHRARAFRKAKTIVRALLEKNQTVGA